MRYEGDIYRPPGEWRSYLLQVTVGCSYNGCRFCGMYKNKRYHVRPLADVLEDIRMAKAHYGDVERVFLCDGDAIALDTQALCTILDALYAAFPALQRVTTYAGPRSTLAKSSAALRQLHDAGLTRAYLGIETGSDALLKAVNKGVTAAQMLQAGRMLVDAGFDLWGIVLLGLGGHSDQVETYARETAQLVNQMGPRHLSAMTYMPVPETPMYADIQAGRFVPATPEDILLECRSLIQNLTVSPLHFTANHASNYLPLKGTLPDDRAAFLARIDQALSGRRTIRDERRRGL